MTIGAVRRVTGENKLMCGQSIIMITTKCGNHILGVLAGVSLDHKIFERVRRDQSTLPEDSEQGKLLFLSVDNPNLGTLKGIELQEVESMSPAHLLMVQ